MKVENTMTTPDPKPCDLRALAERLRAQAIAHPHEIPENTLEWEAADMLDRLADRKNNVQPRIADGKHSNEQSVPKPSLESEKTK